MTSGHGAVVMPQRGDLILYDTNLAPTTARWVPISRFQTLLCRLVLRAESLAETVAETIKPTVCCALVLGANFPRFSSAS